MGRLYCVLIALCLSLGATASAGAPQSGHPAELLVHRWIEVFNSADANRRASFIDQHYSDGLRRGRSTAELVQRDEGLYSQVGGFEIVDLTLSAGGAVALLKEKRGSGYAELTLRVDPQNPTKVTGLLVKPAESPAPGGRGEEEIRPVSLPDTALGKFVSAYLTHINSGDARALEQLLRTSVTPASLREGGPGKAAASAIQLGARVGGFDPARILTSTDRRLIVALKERTGPGFGILTAEVGSDGRINHLTMEGAREIPSASVERMPLSELVPAFDSHLSSLANRDEFSGTVLVADNGKPLFLKGYGYADREQKRLNRPETLFNLGSLDKSFTAVAIGQLVDRGKLDFSDTVGEILPDFPNREIADKVTVHHLLTHTSGMGDYFTPAYDRAGRAATKVSELVPYYAKEKLAFEPGTSERYSNAGYALLGLIVEKTSGQDYYEYLKTNIFAPLGMNQTASYLRSENVPNMAIGYVPGPSGLSPNTRFLPLRGSPAGGGYSTVMDLMKFVDGIRSCRLLSRETTQTMLRPHSPALNYGYGFGFRRVPGDTTFGHAGGAEGVSAHYEGYKKSGLTVVILSNFDAGTAETQMKWFRDRIAV